MTSGAMAVRVKLSVAAGEIPLLAVMVMENTPVFVVTAGVPESTPLEEKVTPDGRAPDSVKVGAGNPVPVTAKLLAVPSLNEVAVTGFFPKPGLSFTVSAMEAVCGVALCRLADTWTVWSPTALVEGVPDRSPVDLTERPLGSAAVFFHFTEPDPAPDTCSCWL